MGSQSTHQLLHPTKHHNQINQLFPEKTKMKVSQVAAVLAVTASASAAPWKDGWKNGHEEKCMDGPFEFTSTYSVVATPDQVVNSDNEFTGGLEGTKGFYEYGINSKEDYICWNIVLENFRGEYQSAADTSTHIHEAPKGQAGPPRLAFPNPVPVGDGKKRISIGCMMGPYETGIVSNGQDTGAGFTVKQIEDNPSAFFTDVHSSLAVPGAVRAQLG